MEKGEERATDEGGRKHAWRRRDEEKKVMTWMGRLNKTCSWWRNP